MRLAYSSSIFQTSNLDIRNHILYLTIRLITFWLRVVMDALSDTFFALSDPTRRSILSRLSEGEATVGELASPFDMSAPAITKHLKVLERAGLIRKEKDGQHRRCILQETPLKGVSDWLEHYSHFWEESFDQLEDVLKNIVAKDKSKSEEVEE